MDELKIRTSREDNVRIGPITIITLIAVICMAVLAMLSVSTANATATISERQAAATLELYLNECAAQEFVASVDDELVDVRNSGKGAAEGAERVKAKMESICAAARTAGKDKVEVEADVEGTTVNAVFSGEKMRMLTIELSIQEDATYRIERWKSTAFQQADPGLGNLWLGA